MPVRFSDHAARRYVERVRGHLTTSQARRELRQLATYASPTPKPPEWAAEPSQPDCWIHLTGDVSCPLIWRDGCLLAATVVVRGTISPEHRQARNAGKAKRRAGRKATKYAQGVARRPRIGPDESEWA